MIDPPKRRARGSATHLPAIGARVTPEAKAALSRLAWALHVPQAQALDALILAAEIDEQGGPAALPRLMGHIDELRKTNDLRALPGPPKSLDSHPVPLPPALTSQCEGEVACVAAGFRPGIDQTNWLVSEGFISRSQQRSLHAGFAAPLATVETAQAGLSHLHAALPLEGVAARLSLPPDAVLHAAALGELLTRLTPLGEAVFPAWQFDRNQGDGRLGNLAAVLAVLEELPYWESRDAFMQTPSDRLRHDALVTPVEWLRQGGTPDAIELALAEWT